MSIFNPALTLAQNAANMKEYIRHALAGEVYCGNNEDGSPAFELDTKANCDRFILSVYDVLFGCAETASRTATALETIAENHGFTIPTAELMREMNKHAAKMAEEYKFEPDPDDEPDDAHGESPDEAQPVWDDDTL